MQSVGERNKIQWPQVEDLIQTKSGWKYLQSLPFIQTESISSSSISFHIGSFLFFSFFHQSNDNRERARVPGLLMLFKPQQTLDLMTEILARSSMNRTTRLKNTEELWQWPLQMSFVRDSLLSSSTVVESNMTREESFSPRICSLLWNLFQSTWTVIGKTVAMAVMLRRF